MRAMKWVLPTTLLAAGFLVCTTSSYGTPAFAKATKKSCTFCHTTVKPSDPGLMMKSLTAAGKYYQEHKTLDGYTGK